MIEWAKLMPKTILENKGARSGLYPKGSVKKTLRYKASKIATNIFKCGDIVEAIDKSASPYGRIPNRLTIGKKYKVIHSKECIIKILNDSNDSVCYYSNRFKKV